MMPSKRDIAPRTAAHKARGEKARMEAPMPSAERMEELARQALRYRTQAQPALKLDTMPIVYNSKLWNMTQARLDGLAVARTFRKSL